MSVVKTLATAIETWLSQKPSRSLSMLARISDVGYSTIRRCAQSEGEPSQEVALAIASVVMTDTQVRSFVGDFWPGLRRYVVDANHARREGDEDILEFMRSEPHFKIMVMASHCDGIDFLDVIRKFGEDMLPFFNDLKNAGHLRPVGNDKWLFDQDYGNVSRELARASLSRLAALCPKSNDAIVDASSAYVAWESLTPKAAKEVSSLTSRYCADIYNVVSKKENHGDILVICGALHNILKGLEGLT